MKKLNLYVVCFISIAVLVSVACNAASKVLIISHCHNRPDFIALQHRTFKAFLKDEHELVVFNDAPEEDMAQQIDDACNDLSIRCFRVPQTDRVKYPGPFPPVSSRHGQALNYSLKKLGFSHDGIVMTVHSDVFLLKEFSANQFLEGYDIAGQLQTRCGNKVQFFHTALMFFRMNTLPRKETITFKHQQINGVWVDTGGSIYHYFKANPQVKILFFQPEHRLFLNHELRVQALGPDDKLVNLDRFYALRPNESVLHRLGFSEKIIRYIAEKKFSPDMEFLLFDTFYHYRRITTCKLSPNPFNQNKIKLLHDFIYDILS